MAEVKQFRLPDVGEGLTEAEIVKWHVRPGDRVAINQTIVEIETAKAMVELPCPYEGVVSDILAGEGQTVDVGTPIIAVDVAGTAAGTPSAEPAGEGAGAAAGPAAEEHAEAPVDEERQPVLVGYGVKTGATKRRPRKRPAASAPSPGSAQPADVAPGTGPTAGAQVAVGGGPAVASAAGRAAVSAAAPAAGPGRVAVLAKPPVRKLAKDLGVDLRTVSGTGPHGTITRADVEAAARAGTARPAPLGAAGAAGTSGTAVASGPAEERVPIRGVRKHTAAAMVASAFTAPHVTEFLQVDVTETMNAVRRLRALPEFPDVKVSPLLLVAKALLLAVRRYPLINSTWDEQAQEIVVKHYVNLGIAVATERGLVVPNIKDAHAKSLPELAAALQELTETARAGRTAPAAMQGGTITITNVGVFGVDAGTPILNPGESAILAFGQVRDLPWVHEGQLAVRKVCTLALSFDHRVVDGELGSYVLRDVGAMLTDPLTMLAYG